MLHSGDLLRSHTSRKQRLRFSLIRESEIQVSLQQEVKEVLKNALRLHEMEKTQLVGVLPVYSYCSGIINVLNKIKNNMELKLSDKN